MPLGNSAIQIAEIRQLQLANQPDGVTRVNVRFDGETVWLLQPQIAELFGCSLENMRLHLKNIYAVGELVQKATSKKSLDVRLEGMRRNRKGQSLLIQ